MTESADDERSARTARGARCAVVGAVRRVARRRRAGRKVDVTGKWAFTVETAAGPGTPTMTFKQDGEKLTGHYTGSSARPTSPARSKGTDIKFTFTADVQGTALNAIYTGTVEARTR